MSGGAGLLKKKKKEACGRRMSSRKKNENLLKSGGIDVRIVLLAWWDAGSGSDVVGVLCTRRSISGDSVTRRGTSSILEYHPRLAPPAYVTYHLSAQAYQSASSP